MREHRPARSDRRALWRENSALLLLTALFLFFLALSSVARSEWLLGWDHAVSLGVQRYRSPMLDLAAAGLTAFGNAELLVAAAVIAGVVLVRKQCPIAARFVAASLLALPLNVGIKLLVGRPRPGGDIEVLLPALGLSFPSGHSMASALVFGFLAFLVWVHARDPRLRQIGTGLLALVPFLVGLSRIYVGAHWLSDVIGGWTVGLFLLLVFAEGYKLLARSEVLTGARRAG